MYGVAGGVMDQREFPPSTRPDTVVPRFDNRSGALSSRNRAGERVAEPFEPADDLGTAPEAQPVQVRGRAACAPRTAPGIPGGGSASEYPAKIFGSRRIAPQSTSDAIRMAP